VRNKWESQKQQKRVSTQKKTAQKKQEVQQQQREERGGASSEVFLIQPLELGKTMRPVMGGMLSSVLSVSKR
jgi:hypothetical protein